MILFITFFVLTFTKKEPKISNKKDELKVKIMYFVKSNCSNNKISKQEFRKICKAIGVTAINKHSKWREHRKISSLIDQLFF